jgi:transcriptional regulator with GAF, ATPase, and Fis domain
LEPGCNANQIFREVTQRLCGSLDIKTALDDTRCYLASLMPADAIHIVQLDEIAGLMRTVAFASSGEPSFLPASDVLQIPRTTLKELNDVQRRLGPILNRPCDIPEVAETFARYGFPPDISLLHLELDRGERIVGAVTISAKGVDRYDERHVRLLELLRVPFAISLSNALRYEEVNLLRARLEEDNRHLRSELQKGSAVVVGTRLGLRHVMEMVEQVAPLDSPVLLLGETGSGKEVLANALHERSSRRDGPLVRVNCGAIPESLVDSELFGHERGAFTGAIATKLGLFERANHGTIFLDEVGELPAAAQVKLLRVVQTMQFERVGGTRTLSTDVRVLTATHRNLQEMVRRGTFREDLWYRLNVFPIHIPPLRERKDDIPTLTRHFMEMRARDMNLSYHPTLAQGAIDQLLAYDWPGNVRELRNVIERALILCQGRPLSFPLLGREREPTKQAPRASNDEPLVSFDQATARHIRRALDLTRGRIKGPGGAAELLGLHPSTLRNKMNRLGIGVDQP